MTSSLEAQVRALLESLTYYDGFRGDKAGWMLDRKKVEAFAHQIRREAFKEAAAHWYDRAVMTDNWEWANTCSEVAIWLTQQAEEGRG